MKQAHLCLLSAFAIVFILTVNSSAQLNYADFSNVNAGDLSFVQAASVQGNKLRLINGLGDSRGAVWYNTTQPVKNGFVCMFSFQITNPQSIPEIPPAERQNGADGFAFLIHTWGTGALGNGGGQIGYASDLDNDPLGIPYSLAIEFDTYYNPQLNDPDGNHISVHNYGQYYNSADENITSIARINSGALGINLKDGNVHNVRIEYDGTTMKIFVDDFTTPKLTFAVNFNNIFIGGENNGTIGFTAGAAAESNYHEILNWSFVTAYVDPCSNFGDAPESSCQTTAPDADTVGPNPPVSYQTPDYHPGADPITGYNTTAKIDTAVLPDRPTEHWAKYYFPSNISSVSSLPLVVLLHGNHETCGTTGIPRTDNNSNYTLYGECLAASPTVVPNHKGYDYLANKLASWGYVVASINSNRGISGINDNSVSSSFPDYYPATTLNPAGAPDTYLIRARGRQVLRHLQRLSEWNEGTTQGVKSVDQLGANRQDYTGWVGMKITTGALPVKIKALGRMYRHGNSQTHTVKIVKVSGNTQVANVSIPMTNWNDGQFKYVNLASTVTLAANTAYYIISQETTGGDFWSGADSTTVDATTIIPTDVVTINGKVKSPNGTTTWDNINAPNQTFGPVDFIYETDTTQIKSETLGTTRNNLSALVGMKFTTGALPVKVKSLGRMFRTGNTQAHVVKIVRVSDKVAVATVTVTAGGTNGQYKYINLASPVTLTPNTAYYLVSQETTGGDSWADSNTVVVPNNAATINGSVSNLNGSTTWTEGATANQIFGPVDFIYEPGTTPTELGVNLKGKIDFNNVGLMGHSRGGEGMRAAYNLLKDTSQPWRNTSNSSRIRSAVNVKGIFEIAPTDKMSPTPLSLNAQDTAWAVILPACDGDVINLNGVKPFDRMLQVATDSPATMKATYFVYGANHNFYNSQWQISEPRASCIGENNTPLFSIPVVTGTGFGSPTQQKTGLLSFLAFFRGNVGASANPAFNQNFNPRYSIPTTFPTTSRVEKGFTVSPSTTETLRFNDLIFPAAELGTDICIKVNIVCSSNDLTTMQASVKEAQLGSFLSGGIITRDHDEDLRTASISWYSANSPSRYFQANAATGASINATTYQTLDFRISRRRNDSVTLPLELNTLNPTGLNNFTNMSIQLVMNDGSLSTPVSLSKYVRLEGPVGTNNVAGQQARGEYHPILRTVRIPLSDFLGANLTQVKGVRYIFNDVSKGAIFLSGIRLSK